MSIMKRQPTHPAKIIKEAYLKPLSLSTTEMAGTLGISRKTLFKIINERGAITPDMALRLARVFDTTLSSGLICRITMICGRQNTDRQSGRQ